MDDKRIDELNTRHEWLKKHVSYRSPEAIGLDEFNHAMALVDGYREELRRAALLTPDAVKAICERAGLDYDLPIDDNIPRWLWRDKLIVCGYFVGVEFNANSHDRACEVYTEGVAGSRVPRTVGQLEDAIKQAKETNA